MKTKILLLSTLVLCLNISVWSQSGDPDFELTWADPSLNVAYADIIKTHTASGVTLSSTVTSLATGQGSATKFNGIKLESKSSAYNANYFGISASKEIEYISIYYIGNSTTAAGYGAIGWESETTPSDNVDYYGASATFAYSTKNLENFQWKTLNLSGLGLNNIRISKCFDSKNFKKNGTEIGAQGSNQTIYVGGIKVWLKSSGPGTISFDPDNSTTRNVGSQISLSSEGSTSIKWQWGSSTPTDGSWESAQVYAENNKPAVPAIGSTNTTLYVRAYNETSHTDGSATYEITDSRSSLTLSFTPDDQTIGTSNNLATSLSWTEDTNAESAKYTVSYSSSNDAIATVNSSGVVIGVTAGSATITATVTATADATYKTTTADITVNVVTALSKNANFSTPTTLLDFTNAAAASTALTMRWTKDNPYYGNDGVDNYIVMTPYTIYSDRATHTWSSNTATGNSSTATWSATDVFLGSTYYTQESSKARYATQRQDRAGNYYCYRTKGVSKVKLLYKSGGNSIYVTLGAFEISAGIAASTTILYTRGNSNSSVDILSLDGIDPSKEYLITLDNSYNNSSTTSSQLYELAFFYDSSVDIYETLSPATEYSTYVTANAVDFTGISGLTAYVATAFAEATGVTMTPVTTVPAETPLMLRKTSGSSFNIPVNAPVDAPETNYLKAGIDKEIKHDTISGYNYVLVANATTGAEFQRIVEGFPATVPVGKAFLALPSAPAASPDRLRIDFEENNATNIENIESTDNAMKFIENGQLLIKRDGITYDALGRIVK